MSTYEDYTERDAAGRFRWVNMGGFRVKEYMPTIMTTCGTVPMGTKIVKPDFSAMPEKPPVKSCPFIDAISSACRRESCAFFDGETCNPGTAQAGKRCPLPGHLACGDNCAMYNQGRCALYSSRKEDNE